MKNLFKFLLIGTFMFTIVTISFSQTTTTSKSSEQTTLTAEQRAAKLVDEMKTVTSLSDDQISKIFPFVIAFFKQKDADAAQYKGHEDALVKDGENRITNLQNSLKTVLTDEQFTKIKNYFDNKKKAENEKAR
jgi:hypothetical protein